ncbi:hypothetical protein Q9L58_005500 [Maublancomyces gigas]|uniref:Uncharacterized protein n=1 Tax=Discina gigas TaxID=1032678 RepID=A0ABR3GI23_9PEZI
MPSTTSDAQIIEFLLLCLENSDKAYNYQHPGTNFEEVAKFSTIAPNASAAYKKLWNIKRKFRQPPAAGSKSKEPNVTDGVSPSLDSPILDSPAKVTKKPRSPKKKKAVSAEIAGQDSE